jgi:hypothetical protein
MKTSSRGRTTRRPGRLLAALAFVAAAPTTSWAQNLGIEFVDSPARGVALNERGDVVGSFSRWPCGDPHACAPVTSPVVWRSEGRIGLPGLGTLLPAPTGIAVDGMVVGSVTDFVSASRAVVWRFVGGSYAVTDIGLLPGATSATAVGVDATGRVIGTASSPAGTRPFSWTAAGGLVDLASLGFPAEAVLGTSPGGVVATTAHTYQVDKPASVRSLALPPKGYHPPFPYAMGVNDGGDVAAFLATTTSDPVFYLHRYHAADGRWQLLSSSPNGNLSSWGVGSIDNDLTVSATVTSVGVIAAGPEGVAVPLASQLSPAYDGVAVGAAGERRAASGTLASAMIGRSLRLVRLVPLAPCVGYCLRVASLQMKGVFVDDPRAPGSCTPAAANKVTATLTVTDADGNPAPGVRVSARFLDDYALNKRVNAKTSASGKAVFRHRGPACVGAIALLVESATASGATFDRSVGVLTNYVIPLP